MNEVPQANGGASIKRLVLRWPLLILAIVLLFGMIWFYVVPFLIRYQAEVGFQTAKRTINPNELTSWAKTEFTRHPPTNGLGFSIIPSDEIPASLEHLFRMTSCQPQACAMFPSSDRNPYMMVGWGSMGIRWNFYIGDVTSAFPSTGASNPFGAWQTEWVPGLYFCHE